MNKRHRVASYRKRRRKLCWYILRFVYINAYRSLSKTSKTLRAAMCWWGQSWDVVEKADPLDKEEVLDDHERGSEKDVYRHTPFSEALYLKSSLKEEESYL